jgi:isopenicillin-N epimerase
MVPVMPFGSGSVPSPPSPLPRSDRARWLLDPGVTFLNHGSFGAVMRSVRQLHIAAQDRIESRPIEMLGRRWRELLAPARERVGAFLGMSPGSFGFVTNATEGVNAVLQSTQLSAGDELVTTTHVYNAVRNAMRRRARDCGAACVEVPVELPLAAPGAVTDAVVGAITARTRLVVVDHVSSATALVFPVREIVEACRARGVDVLVDGAHVPGMLKVDVEALGATYWTGNLHKWCCAPKGTAVLWAAPGRRGTLKPAVVSHFLDEGLPAEFDWQGTRDLAAWTVAGAAIDAMAEFGWDAVRRHNAQMAAWAQRMLCERWEVEPIAPLGAMLGSMCTVPLPAEVCARFRTAAEFQEALYAEDRIEVPVIEFGGRWHVRPSAQAYNRAEEYDRLAQAVIEHASRA